MKRHACFSVTKSNFKHIDARESSKNGMILYCRRELNKKKLCEDQQTNEKKNNSNNFTKPNF